MERDRFLTEAMGYHVHRYEHTPPQYRFSECVLPDCYHVFDGHNEDIIDFSTWQGFGKLWEWTQEQDWFMFFMGRRGLHTAHCDWYTNNEIIHPDRFANAVYEFLKEQSND